jgi:hypothetical protein
MVIETGFSRRGRGDDARGGGDDVNDNVNVDVDVAGGEPAGVDVEPTMEVPVEAPLALDDAGGGGGGGTSKLLVTHICTALLAHVVVPTTHQHTPGLIL